MKKSHRELKVWQKSVELVDNTYNLIENFPQKELYALSNQLRKAIVSVASNIAEGSARRSDKEFVRFLNIAYGSLMEADTQIYIAAKRNYISEEDTARITISLNEVGRMINGLRNYLLKSKV